MNEETRTRIQNVLSEGANCDRFFKIDEGRKDPIPL